MLNRPGFVISYTMNTGTGRLQVGSALQVIDMVEDLRRAGAWAISIENARGLSILADNLGSAVVVKRQVPD